MENILIHMSPKKCDPYRPPNSTMPGGTDLWNTKVVLRLGRGSVMQYQATYLQSLSSPYRVELKGWETRYNWHQTEMEQKAVSRGSPGDKGDGEKYVLQLA